MEKEAMVKRADEILERVESIDKERKVLVKELQDLLPIKAGDKVKVISIVDNSHKRFAFVNEVKIVPRGKEEKSRIEFDLQKCKADGTKSQHGDYLGYQETISKI